MIRIPPALTLPSRTSRVVIGTAAVAIGIVATALVLNRRAARESVDTLDAVPFAIVSSLPIAANAQSTDRSVLRLACTDDRRVIMVLRTKLAVGKEFYTPGQDADATIFVGDPQNRIETRMRLVERSVYDTLVSTKLSGTALSALGSFFGNASPRQVSVVTLETDTRLTGQVGRGQITTFAGECR